MHEGASRDGNDKQSPANPKATLSKGDTIIDIDNVQDAGPLEPSYVEAYMRFMYWTCVSPFNPTKNVGKGDSKTWLDAVLNFSQKVNGIFPCIYFFILDIQQSNVSM